MVVGENRYAKVEVHELSVTKGDRVVDKPFLVQWVKVRALGVAFVDSITPMVTDVEAKR